MRVALLPPTNEPLHLEVCTFAAMTDRRAAAAAAVRDVLQRFDDALERNDVEGALDLCTEDVVFIGSGEGEQAVGRKAIVEMAMRLADRASDTQFRVADATFDIDVQGDVALFTSFGTAHLRSQRALREGPYRLTGVLVRRAGTWKLRVHHGSEPLAW